MACASEFQREAKWLHDADPSVCVTVATVGVHLQASQQSHSQSPMSERRRARHSSDAGRNRQYSLQRYAPGLLHDCGECSMMGRSVTTMLQFTLCV